MKRLSAFLLSLVLMLSMMPVVSAEPATASTVTPPAIPTTGDVWDGSIEQPTKLVQKDGVYYYEITKCSQLAYVAQMGGDWLSRSYILANNLIFNDVELKWDNDGRLINESSSLYKWIPMGNYTATFDGNSKVISGLYSDDTDNTTGNGLFYSADRANIHDVIITNSYISGRESVGGIVGNGGGVSNCVFSGLVKGDSDVGGIVGYDIGDGSISNCISFATIIGGSCVGGVIGNTWETVRSCINYGTVDGKNSVGGIAGSSYGVYHCVNYAEIKGVDHVGGILGNNGYIIGINECINYGNIFGNSYIGGITGGGGYSFTVEDSYNTATVTGEEYVGGIIGGGSSSISIRCCYNTGNVVSSDSSATGAIIGTDGILFGKGTAAFCHYLKNDTVNASLFGCGNISSSGASEPDGFEANNDNELKQSSTFENWDFDSTWAISHLHNNGYPYLSWQDVISIPLTGLGLSQTTLSLGTGDTAYLTANPQPVAASLPALTWKSNKTSVATVNGNGRVTAAGAGTATITVSGGGFSATCTVTVTARATEEYSLGELTVRDANGVALTAIPRGSFLVTIPITKLTAGGNTMVMLASYTASGQFKGLLYASVEDVPVGATVKITLPVDNSKGDIALLKAFTIASLSNPVPIGAASSFPTQ